MAHEEPKPGPEPSVACTLTPEQLAAGRQSLIPGLIDRALEITELLDGVRLRFDSKPGLLQDLARVVEQEREGCRFLSFELKADPGSGPVTLEVTGPAGTAEMLRRL